MRMLLLPSLEKPTEEDSSLLLMKCLAEVAIKRGWGIHLVVPPETPIEGWPQGVHVSRIQYDCWSRHIAALNASVPVSHLVHTGNESLAVDCIVTTDHMAAYVVYLYLQHEFASLAPPIYTASASSTYIGADEMAGRGDQQSQIAAHILGASVAVNFQPTAFMRDRVIDAGRVYLGPSLYEGLARNTLVTQIGPWCRVLDEVRAERHPKFSLYYGGRFTTTKLGQNAVKQYIRMVEGGRDCDIFVSAMGNYRRLDDLLKKEGGSGIVQVFTKLSAEEAWRMMSQCHAAMFYQSLKILPSSPYEQIYCGLLTLIKDYGYEKALLPPDYPWVFRTETEGAAMLRWIYDNYDEAYAKVPAWQKWVRENMDREVAYSKACEIMERQITEERTRVRTAYTLTDLTNEQFSNALAAVGEGAGWQSVIKAMVKLGVKFHGEAHKSELGRALCPIHLYRHFIPDEWQDSNEDVMPTFRRKK